jgi:hypothetical protein
MVSDEQSATKWSSEAINLAPTSRSMGSSRCMARRDMADDCARDSRESNGEKKVSQSRIDVQSHVTGGALAFLLDMAQAGSRRSASSTETC